MQLHLKKSSKLDFRRFQSREFEQKREALGFGQPKSGSRLASPASHMSRRPQVIVAFRRFLLEDPLHLQLVHQ